MNKILVSLFLCLASTSSISSASLDQEFVSVSADLNGEKLQFFLSNNSKGRIYYNVDFYSEENLHLVVFLESTGDALSSRPLSLGRITPSIRALESSGSETRSIYVLNYYEELKKYSGRIILYWSVDLFVAPENGESELNRRSGAVEACIKFGLVVDCEKSNDKLIIYNSINSHYGEPK